MQCIESILKAVYDFFVEAVFSGMVGITSIGTIIGYTRILV